jgi:DNA-binding GntR family transcriptional regulator
MVRVPPGDRRTSQLPSKRIAAAIRARLTADEWAPGERLPAVAEFATEYEVARGTVVAALRRIEADELIEIVPNWGTFRK